MRRALWLGLAAWSACGGGAAPAAGHDAGPDLAAQPDADAAGAEVSLIEVGYLTDGGEPPGDGALLPAWRSGASLRAVLLKPAGAPDRIFQGIHDATLGTDCHFVRASDGVMRCMPLQVPDVFADDGCKVPVAAVARGCAPPTHVSRVESCRATGHRVGARVDSSKLYTKVQQGCELLAPGPDAFALTAVPASAFVAGAEVREDRGGDLSMRYWASEDGGLFPIGVWDTERDAACAAGSGDYDERCAPSGVAVVPARAADFTDPACKSPAAGRVSRCDADPVSAASVFTQGLCGPTTVFVGATKLEGFSYGLTGGTCAPRTDARADIELYAPGEPIEPFALPAMTTVLDGVGRLKARRYMTATDTIVDSFPVFQDTLLRAGCFPRPTTLGERCVPQDAVEATYFSDGACTTPVYAEIARGPAPGCDQQRPRVLVMSGQDFDGCRGLVVMQRLFEVGAPITPAKLWRNDDGACAEATASDVATLNVFTATPATDATTVALESVIE